MVSDLKCTAIQYHPLNTTPHYFRFDLCTGWYFNHPVILCGWSLCTQTVHTNTHNTARFNHTPNRVIPLLPVNTCRSHVANNTKQLIGVGWSVRYLLTQSYMTVMLSFDLFPISPHALHSYPQFIFSPFAIFVLALFVCAFPWFEWGSLGEWVFYPQKCEPCLRTGKPPNI